ncbi:MULTISPECIES: GNAT family N-acetyltransferase [Yersinia]|uniref:N-acetyltransferase domain-containing protein n=2 Tax=Yersinia TaxID=629 RepID=B7UF44_YERPU|nr:MULTISPECIES: GNAT family protein [Yersinia]MBO1551377.1 GNAT family N-acetyltransferase [Yersinia pseudotuberculosis]MBO1562453.1 GNAT family N-acetyltransferase [Yersinia pseudotuberculosis]MBO1571430.1 GNAT family N-acetyltransferase [Yersinia pseudotuberculosis]MBO1586382.1 GNAT family N-acetyltransferase [Yersinia pseudotuberculosis]MBO1631792.1 GNAT family N-acetyltransferase [Yersinia pseudotuberculosis]
MLRVATLKDFKFIYKLFIQEAQHRHFNHDIYSSFLKRFGFKRELKRIIKYGKRIYNDERATALIFTRENEPVGFTIISVNASDECIELWLAAIAEKHRGKGSGKEMTGQVLKLLGSEGLNIYARCYNRSEVMINILKSYNFKIDPRFAHPEMKLLLFTPR